MPRRPATAAFLLCLLAACTPQTPPAASTPATTPAPPKDDAPPYAFDPAQEAGVDRRCIAHIMTFPLLTRNGSPAIAATINGIQGALYLNPSEDILGVYDSSEITFPTTDTLDMQTIADSITVYMTTVDTLRIAQGTAHAVDAIKLGTIRHQRIAGNILPLGSLGFDIIGNYDLLLDMPAQRAMMFRTTNAPGCPPLAQWLDKPRYLTPIQYGANGFRNLVTVMLNNHPVGMTLEPGSNLSILNRDDALSTGLTPAELKAGTDIRTQASSVLLGSRVRFTTVSIGNAHDDPLDTNVEHSRYNLLGLRFFRNRKVLMAFPEAMLYFTGTHPDIGPPDTTRAEPSPITSRTANATAIEPGLHLAPKANTPPPSVKVTTH